MQEASKILPSVAMKLHSQATVSKAVAGYAATELASRPENGPRKVLFNSGHGPRL